MKNRSFCLRTLLIHSLSLGLLALGNPAAAAERIGVFIDPLFEYYLSVEDLEIFVREGRITDNFAFYARRLSPEDQERLRDLLTRDFGLSHVAVGQFTYTQIGETLIRRLTPVVRSSSDEAEFHAWRAAFILGAMEPDGLTLLNVLRKFPLDTITLDFQETRQAVEDASQLLRQKDQWITRIQQIAEASTTVTAALQPPTSSVTQPNPDQLGSYSWQTFSLNLRNPERDQSTPAQVYIPTGISTPIPMIVISHGIASNLDTFAYLAEHLASQGFGVGVLEHPETSSTRFQTFLSGLDSRPDPNSAFIARPLDITTLLNEIELRAESDPIWQQLNTDHVGLLGQSFGGYTVLASAGAELDFERIRSICDVPPNKSNFNISRVLQCRAIALPEGTKPNLHDDRVKAVVAVNPVTSVLFGPEGLSSIQIPTMMIGGSADFFAPTVPEQIEAFTWLTTPERYLVAVDEGTHFSFLSGKGEGGAIPVPSELIGPDPEKAHPSLKLLSTAFFKTYIADQPEFENFLTQTYLNTLEMNPFEFSIVRSLSLDQLAQSN